MGEIMIYQEVQDYLERHGFEFIDFGMWFLKGVEDGFGIQLGFRTEDPCWLSVAPVNHAYETCPPVEFNGFSSMSDMDGSLRIYLDQLVFLCKSFQSAME